MRAVVDPNVIISALPSSGGAPPALVVEDPSEHPFTAQSRDPGDDYLLALAITASAVLVTGDSDLLELSEDLPIHSPRSFLATL